MTTPTRERKQLLCDIFTTALEGGIGYWSAAEEYHWRLDVPDETPFDESQDLDGFYAVIEDLEDGKVYRIDADVIRMGIGYIADGIAQVRSDIRATVLLLDRTNGEEGDYDAETADCIVQAGLFGEVVYG